MLSSNKIKFICEDAKAASFILTEEGLRVSVSLNIKPSMVKFLQPQVRRGGKFFVYVISTTIREINSISVSNTYYQLLNRAMINCRKAKQLAIQEEIKHLTYNQLTLNL